MKDQSVHIYLCSLLMTTLTRHPSYHFLSPQGNTSAGKDRHWSNRMPLKYCFHYLVPLGSSRILNPCSTIEKGGHKVCKVLVSIKKKNHVIDVPWLDLPWHDCNLYTGLRLYSFFNGIEQLRFSRLFHLNSK